MIERLRGMFENQALDEWYNIMKALFSCNRLVQGSPTSPYVIQSLPASYEPF
jgi:hypothetical protein